MKTPRLKLALERSCPDTSALGEASGANGASYCQGCQKTVFDLRTATEATASAHLMLYGTELCARIRCDDDGIAILRVDRMARVAMRGSMRRDVVALGMSAVLGVGNAACGAVATTQAPTATQAPATTPAAEVAPAQNVAAPTAQQSGDVDTDQDRIRDADDMCPNEPENYNGQEDEDGCHDRVFVGLVVDQCDVSVSDRVLFAQASAALLPRDTALMDAVAQALTNSRDMRVRVRGYRSASERRHSALSRQRAQTVVDELVRRGIDASRLDVVDEGVIENAGDSERFQAVDFDVHITACP